MHVTAEFLPVSPADSELQQVTKTVLNNQACSTVEFISSSISFYSGITVAMTLKSLRTSFKFYFALLAFCSNLSSKRTII